MHATSCTTNTTKIQWMKSWVRKMEHCKEYLFTCVYWHMSWCVHLCFYTFPITGLSFSWMYSSSWGFFFLTKDTIYMIKLNKYILCGVFSFWYISYNIVFDTSLLLSCTPEVPLVLYLFLLISVVWLWAGLHMGYRYLWMLILYVIFNCLLVSSFVYLSVWLLACLFIYFFIYLFIYGIHFPTLLLTAV